MDVARATIKVNSPTSFIKNFLNFSVISLYGPFT
jgi:hypothetical protein